MKLLYPEFLWALFALSIPIIIHLFNFRKFTKVYFSNIELLKEVKLETKSKSRLKHLLILLIRLLLVTFLVFAFAQPYIPVENEKQHGEGDVCYRASMTTKDILFMKKELHNVQDENIVLQAKLKISLQINDELKDTSNNVIKDMVNTEIEIYSSSSFFNIYQYILF